MMKESQPVAVIPGSAVEKTPFAPSSAPSTAGLKISRYFTAPGSDPFREVTWEFRTASIANENGESVFEQSQVEVPNFWSQTATNVVASKYFRGALRTPQRETSVKQLIGRVVDTITSWGIQDGYFAGSEEAQNFHAELTHLLLMQKASFNSPVWFNVGIEPHPQSSACFILSVEDTMESILDWYKVEGMIFKYGSGSGVNLSPIRSSSESLAGGGTASGPVSFMRAADASAGVIKSGGKTRRAAKMIVLNADHPDIEKFIACKWQEEKKARTLVDAGFDASLDGEAYSSVFFQNANNSVRATDEFMRAALEDKPWDLKGVTTGKVMKTVKARELLRMIAEATWHCGDPGMQFDTTFNKWHTCPNSGRINATNPCSEYAHLDNSACNLASLNLMKFVDDEGRFRIADFRNAVRTMTIAMDILVDNSSYPTPKITENAKNFRELGLGYANLGALLMSLGLPYDSDGGRAYAATVTALMCGEAYRTSAEIAGAKGPYGGFTKNREPQLNVIRMHRDALIHVDDRLVPKELFAAAAHAWEEALRLGTANGVRNSQMSVVAPTGTIGFMMDCDTTGVEPDIALIKYKKLVGGGLIKIVNQTVPHALKRLGYSEADARVILEYLDRQETIEGTPALNPKDLPVFDCAFKPAKGTRSIHYLGHVRMMGVVQPFISGAISKTVNVPAEATTEDILETYLEAWKAGVKAIAIYRDGSKRVQPLSTGKFGEGKQGAAVHSTKNGEPLTEIPSADGAKHRPQRRYLPDERHAITHKFSIAGHDGYVTVGLYEDGKPGEIFIVMSKEGTVISGLLDAFATAISLALQYGVPLEALVKKFSHMRFEPAGVTSNPQIRFAQSILDYVFRWMALKFLPADKQPTPPATVTDLAAKQADITLPSSTVGTTSSLEPVRQTEVTQLFQGQVDAPPCPDCGAMMIRSGNCYKCFNCGATSGCS